MQNYIYMKCGKGTCLRSSQMPIDLGVAILNFGVIECTKVRNVSLLHIEGTLMPINHSLKFQLMLNTNPFPILIGLIQIIGGPCVCRLKNPRVVQRNNPESFPRMFLGRIAIGFHSWHTCIQGPEVSIDFKVKNLYSYAWLKTSCKGPVKVVIDIHLETFVGCDLCSVRNF